MRSKYYKIGRGDEEDERKKFLEEYLEKEEQRRKESKEVIKELREEFTGHRNIFIPNEVLDEIIDDIEYDEEHKPTGDYYLLKDLLLFRLAHSNYAKEGNKPLRGNALKKM